MLTIRRKKKGSRVIAIVHAKYWYADVPKVLNSLTVLPFVVCEWLELNDGKKNHIEGKVTRATFRKKQDAVDFYKKLKVKKS